MTSSSVHHTPVLRFLKEGHRYNLDILWPKSYYKQNFVGLGLKMVKAILFFIFSGS